MDNDFKECRNCNSGWQIWLGHESYCGWCGHPVKGFHFECDTPSDHLFIYADQSGPTDDEPYRLALRVVNSGLVKVKIDDIKIVENH